MRRYHRHCHMANVDLPLSSQRLEEELRLHKCSTRECIEQFYLDKLKQVGQLVSTHGPIQSHTLLTDLFCRGLWSRTGLVA
jgi:hypothetical protein